MRPSLSLCAVSPQDVLESAPIGDTLTPSTPSWGTDPAVLLWGHRSSLTQDTRLNVLPNGTTWRSANLINTEEIFSSHLTCTRHPPAVGLMHMVNEEKRSLGSQTLAGKFIRMNNRDVCKYIRAYININI